MSQKIIRSLCYFTEEASPAVVDRLIHIQEKLEKAGFIIQTIRICTDEKDFAKLEATYTQKSLLLSVGNCDLKYVIENKYDFFKATRTSCHVDISNGVEEAHIDWLFSLMREAPEKLFQFAFVANNVASSPYFPSANYAQTGFAIGLQSTDLAGGSKNIQEWFQNKQNTWDELLSLFGKELDFLGIDSSVAPLFTNNSSLVYHIERFLGSFDQAVLSDVFLQITEFIKKENPRPIGLCGLMFPCLEDFELAEAYERGDFDLERNLFLSLHSGLGIDTYPIAINESPERVLDILRLLIGLSNKYKKPLSARFISDGKAKIGEMTKFGNQYLKNVILRKL